jgi:glycine dehydrogenase subunit 1
MPYIANTDDDRRRMLDAIGVASFEDLIANIPEGVRLKRDLRLPPALSEYEATVWLQELAAKNKHAGEYLCFLGGGAYDHYIPSVVNHILLRSEFYTAYTPYQPEVSQGTLQAIYEYQTMICELTGMEVSNASMYDAGSAMAEAALLASGEREAKRVLISAGVHPNYIRIAKTYCMGQGIVIEEVGLEEGVTSIEDLKQKLDQPAAAVIVQHPNFLGNLEEVHQLGPIIRDSGALFFSVNDPISLGLLEPPGRYGVDVVVGEGQVLGNATNFGGPYLGIFASKADLIRKLPGRIAAETVDKNGRRGFVLTLQTREQHIRREKATSNICTNQGLMMLAATVYMALMGKQGLQEVAHHCLQRSHYLAEGISALRGYRLKFQQPFFKEFVVEGPRPARDILRAVLDDRILGGIDLAFFGPEYENAFLVAATEKRTKAEMDRLVEALERAAA